MAIAVGGAGQGLGGMMHYTGYGSYTAHRHQHIALMVDRTARLYAAWDKSFPGPLRHAFPHRLLAQALAASPALAGFFFL